MFNISLRQLAQALGGEVCGQQVVCPGPRHSVKDRSLAVRLDPNAPAGFVVHSFSGDDWRDCREHVRQKLGLPPWAPGDEQDRRVPSERIREFDRSAVDAQAEERRPRSEDDLLRIQHAVAIWNEATEPRRTLAERYLRFRCLELTDQLTGTVLRFHPRCPWRDENTGRTIFVPALIAAFRSIDDDAVTAIHRIVLNRDGSKHGRRMLGIVSRAAVKLAPVNGELFVGEGVETCMAAQQLGYRPAWALGSVGAISFFPLLDGVRRLHILAEAGTASARAIQLCGRRWYRAGRRVRVIRPDPGCSDLNDELIARSAS